MTVTEGGRQGVDVVELSETRLRITINGVANEVEVEKIYRTDRHFGEFRSLDHLIDVLRRLDDQAD